MSKEDESVSETSKQNVTVPFQVSLDPAVTVKLQKLKLKLSAASLMIAELIDDVNSTITSLLVEINRSQAEKAKDVTVTNVTGDKANKEVIATDRSK